MIGNYKVLKELKKHLHQNFGSAIVQVILFGSRTKDNKKGYSDYDVLIILDQDYSWKDENRILDLCYDIDLKYNILIDVHLISKREMSSLRGKQPFIQDALINGIYG